MSYQPQFSITPALLARVEQIAVLRERIPAATVEALWIWDALGVTKQGAIKLMQPLLEAGLIQRVGTRKYGRYILT